MPRSALWLLSITQQSLQFPENLAFKWFVFLFTGNHLNSARSLTIGCHEKVESECVYGMFKGRETRDDQVYFRD